MIDKLISEIQQRCEHLLTQEQLAIIRESLASYGMACVMDSAIREEAMQVCEQG